MLFSKKKAKTFGDVEKSSYLCTRNSEIRHALVAQLVEHLTLNQGVQGSSPCRRTNNSVMAASFRCLPSFFLRYSNGQQSQ